LLRAESAQHGPVRVYTSGDSAERRGRDYADHVAIVPVPEREDGLDLDAVLRDLAACGVHSVLVEGGGKTWAAFLNAGIAHRVALFLASKLLGSGGAVPLVDLQSVERPELGWRMERERTIPLGDDLLMLGRIAGRS
jgi:diaminohydroxyphosphoribosylaminopyrimidine deaminase/5-amino-6-(5-phosphoribosylamino)uracil reductase